MHFHRMKVLHAGPPHCILVESTAKGLCEFCDIGWRMIPRAQFGVTCCDLNVSKGSKFMSQFSRRMIWPALVCAGVLASGCASVDDVKAARAAADSAAMAATAAQARADDAFTAAQAASASAQQATNAATQATTVAAAAQTAAQTATASAAQIHDQILADEQRRTAERQAAEQAAANRVRLARGERG